MNIAAPDQSELRQRLLAVLAAEIEGFSEDMLGWRFDELDIDSFGLLSLRAAIETTLSVALSDAEWTTLRSPADILEVAVRRGGEGFDPTGTNAPAAATRSYELGMPQLALRGLSESWLFKELGDFHWSLISHGLSVPSARIVDGEGHRLYATFSRLRIDSSNSLAAFNEGDRVLISGTLSRFGAGLFFGDYQLIGQTSKVEARVMSTFAYRDGDTGNTRLLRGQPTVPDSCSVPALSKMPDFGKEYQALRANPPNRTKPLHTERYAIEPFRDVNNAGLVYFAAFPTIADICESQRSGNPAQYARNTSTYARDVFYLANSDIDDSLDYVLLSREERGNRMATRSAISRASDNTLMAVLETTKERSDA